MFFFFVSRFFHSDLDWYKHWVMAVINQPDCAHFNFQPCTSLILTTLSLNAVLVWSLSSFTHDGPWCVFCVQHFQGCWWAAFLLEYKNFINNKKEKSREREKKKGSGFLELRKENSALKLLWNYFVLLVSPAKSYSHWSQWELCHRIK